MDLHIPEIVAGFEKFAADFANTISSKYQFTDMTHRYGIEEPLEGMTMQRLTEMIDLDKRENK